VAPGPDAGCPVSGGGPDGLHDGLCRRNHDWLQSDAPAPDDQNDTYEHDTHAHDRDIAVERKQHADDSDGADDDDHPGDHPESHDREIAAVHRL
jgi:hypothetical protein